jgi:hypothetical protein
MKPMKMREVKADPEPEPLLAARRGLMDPSTMTSSGPVHRGMRSA